MTHDPHDLVSNSRRVRVHSGALGSKHVMAEGKVVAYSEHPQILVEADDGTQSWWPVTLPIDVVETPAVVEPTRRGDQIVPTPLPGPIDDHVDYVSGPIPTAEQPATVRRTRRNGDA